MKENRKLGGILGIIGALMGIFGTWYLFMNWFELSLHAEAAEPGCEILLSYLFPALSDVGIIAGVLYAVSAYGFFTAAAWAFPVASIAVIMALQGSWFINVPLMAAGLPPIFFPLFFPNLLLYFLLFKSVRNYPWSRVLLAMFTGIAMILTFMNGVASWSRIITIGAPLFILVQRMNWVAMIGMAVVTGATLLSPKQKEWVRVLGISAALLEVIVGFPLGIATAGTLGRFSLFLLAPILCAGLLIVFLRPKTWYKWVGSVES